MMNIIDAAEKSQMYATEAWKKIRAYFENTDISKMPQLSKMPEIRWKKFGFHVAGRCYYKDDYIEMNINYLNSPDAEKFVKNTTIHELAHSVAYRIFQSPGHDYYWKHIAMIMGDDGNRCHDYAQPTNCKRKQYNCTCGATIDLSPLQVKRAKLGKYVCSTCKKNLKSMFVEC